MPRISLPRTRHRVRHISLAGARKIDLKAGVTFFHVLSKLAVGGIEELDTVGARASSNPAGGALVV